jgi:uncharacterized membrane protein
MGNKIYRPVIGELLLDRFSVAPAVVFYFIYVLGMIIFAVSPAMTSGDSMTALQNGAMFGFFAYATYDLTNQATLRRWSSLLSAMDIAWGTIVSGSASALGYLIARMIMTPAAV